MSEDELREKIAKECYEGWKGNRWEDVDILCPSGFDRQSAYKHAESILALLAPIVAERDELRKMLSKVLDKIECAQELFRLPGVVDHDCTGDLSEHPCLSCVEAHLKEAPHGEDNQG